MDAPTSEFTELITHPFDFRVGKTYEIRQSLEDETRILKATAEALKKDKPAVLNTNPNIRSLFKILVIGADDLEKERFILYGLENGEKKDITVDPEILRRGFVYKDNTLVYFFGKPEYDNKESLFGDYMQDWYWYPLTPKNIQNINIILSKDVQKVLRNGGISRFDEELPPATLPTTTVTSSRTPSSTTTTNSRPGYTTTTTRSPQSYGREQNDDTISASGIGSSSTTTTTRSPQSYGKEQNDDTISASGIGSSSTDDLLTKPAEVPPDEEPPPAEPAPPPRLPPRPKVTSADIAFAPERDFNRGPTQVRKNGGKRHSGRKSKKLRKNKRRVTRRKQFT